MSKALITYKQILNLKKGLIFDEKILGNIYKNIIDTIEDTQQFGKDSKAYTSVEGETNIGDIQSETIDDFLKEITSRQLEIRSLRIYSSFSSYSRDEPYSYTVDAYLGKYSNNHINIHGSDERWVLDSKDKLDFCFNKVPLISITKKSIPIRFVNFVFNGKLLAIAWIIVILSILFSRFFPNIYYSWMSVFITAYALIGVAVQVFLDQENKTPVAKFVLKEEKEDKKGISTIEYVEKQPSIIKIILFIFGFAGFVSAIMQIIEFAKKFNWIR